MARTATGMFTKKNQRHDRVCVKKPPIKGPIASPTVPIPAHTPIPLLRSSGGKAVLRIEREAEKKAAAPKPCTTRTTISHQSACASPEAAEPAINTTVPINSTLRRPKMSAGRPAATDGAARASR